MAHERELGIIICAESPPTHLGFSFQISDNVDVKVGEYVEVPAGRYIIVGRITEVRTYNEYFKSPAFVKDHMLRQLPVTARFPAHIGRWRVAEVRIVGMFENNRLHPPNIAPEPGERVYRIDQRLLSRLLGLCEDGAFMGTMYGNENIRVTLDIDKLVMMHIAVFGATGTGKSYTVGVLVEELLEHGYPVVIIDPHGEYFTLQMKNDNPNEISILRKLGLEPRAFPTRILSPAYRGTGELTIRFDSLSVDALAEICNLTPTMNDLLYIAMRALRDRGVSKIGPDVLLKELRRQAMEWGFSSKTQVSLARRISILKEIGIFGDGIDPAEVVRPGTATIIDVSGEMEEHVRRTFVGAFLNELFEARRKGIIPPLLVVVEESHRFAPQEEETFSKSVLRKIAREGRKFGIGLCITSQRVVGLDKDVISQCGTKIILRIDSRTDLDYIRPYIPAEDFQRIPYLPTGTATITGVAVRHSILAEIRPRKSKHGGILSVIESKQRWQQQANEGRRNKLHEFM
ncbi:MAG: helicase HerA-like domain-containing protein [Candidatus Baldrarchaeia archaeon]